MIKPNNEFQEKIKAMGVKQWQIADALGISGSVLSRWLRYRLTDEQQHKIELAVKAIVEENKEND